MKIAVYNFKGGVGKTSISVNLSRILDYGIVTNDVYSPLEKVIQKPYSKLKPNEELLEIPTDLNVIFDLGGYVDERATKMLNVSDYVIVPVVNDFINLQVSISAINEIKKINDKIIIIANMTKKGDFEEIKRVIDNFYNYPVFELKYSKAFPNMFRDKEAIGDMIRRGGLKQYLYQDIEKQFDNIIKYITR